MAVRERSTITTGQAAPLGYLPSTYKQRWSNLLAWRNVRNQAQGAGAPAAPAAPGVAPVPGAKPPGQGTGPALDAQYGIDASQLLFRNTNTVNDLTLAGQRDTTDYQESMRRLAVQRAQALDNANVSANKAGLFYSGQRQKERGRLEAQYRDSEADVSNNYTRAMQDRQEQVNRINESQPLDLESLRQAAIGRGIQAKADAPPPAGSMLPGANPVAASGQLGLLQQWHDQAAGALAKRRARR